MRTRTPRFDRVIYTPHMLASRVDVLFNREPIITGLPVTAGEIVYDRGAAILARSTIQISCHEDDHLQPWGRLLPTATEDGPLSPGGYELQAWRGIHYGDGTEELIPLGVFPTQHTDIDASTLLATVEGCDRSQQVIDARLEEDYSIAAGTNYGTAIQAFIAAGVSGLTYAFQTTTRTTQAIVWPAETDRWDAAQQMARDISCELFFDGLGRNVLRTEPGAESSPAITLEVGDGKQLSSLHLALTRDGTFNRVVAIGSNSTAPTVYRGVATVDDPASPTYYDGPFGHKVRFYASPVISSNEQAGAAAATVLTSSSGLERGLSFAMLPNPVIEPGDVARIICPALDIDELHILDGFPIGLTADSLVEVG